MVSPEDRHVSDGAGAPNGNGHYANGERVPLLAVSLALPYTETERIRRESGVKMQPEWRRFARIMSAPVWRGRGLDFTESGATFEHAISATGFGRFHVALLMLCGIIYANTAVGITILSFVLPAAECDLQMTTPLKGWLNATPLFGMVLGSYFWGCLADTQGRKIVLIASHLLDGICGIASSFTLNYYAFVALRFFNGFAITGALGICFPYLGEFQSTKYREKILCWMELFWTLGVIVLPAIAWAIIPLRFDFPLFRWESWQVFVAVCAVPSLVLAAVLFLFPESPKFLLEVGEYDSSLMILQRIYEINSGKSSENYPVKTLRESPRRQSLGGESIRSGRSIKSVHDVRALLSDVWLQTKLLISSEFLWRTFLACAIQFCLTTSYYTLMLWFPELFDRFENFEEQHPGQSASLCAVSSGGVQAEPTFTNCRERHIEDSVFLHTIIVGVACIPTSFWLPLCVHRLGTKFFLVFSLWVAGAVTVFLYFVQNAVQNLVLSCIFEALTSLGISTVYCVLVDLFPTNLRVMAAALSLTFGRGGALFGNLFFSYLIDANCVAPIALFSSLLFIAGALCVLLPNTGKNELD